MFAALDCLNRARGAMCRLADQLSKRGVRVIARQSAVLEIEGAKAGPAIIDDIRVHFSSRPAEAAELASIDSLSMIAPSDGSALSVSSLRRHLEGIAEVIRPLGPSGGGGGGACSAALVRFAKVLSESMPWEAAQVCQCLLFNEAKSSREPLVAAPLSVLRGSHSSAREFVRLVKSGSAELIGELVGRAQQRVAARMEQIGVSEWLGDCSTVAVVGLGSIKRERMVTEPQQQQQQARPRSPPSGERRHRQRQQQHARAASSSASSCSRPARTRRRGRGRHRHCQHCLSRSSSSIGGAGGQQGLAAKPRSAARDDGERSVDASQREKASRESISPAEKKPESESQSGRRKASQVALPSQNQPQEPH